MSWNEYIVVLFTLCVTNNCIACFDLNIKSDNDQVQEMKRRIEQRWSAFCNLDSITTQRKKEEIMEGVTLKDRKELQTGSGNRVVWQVLPGM